ncbi:hypothetical protein AJ80_03155 [Polytolypa hystricis UAMH7299]|uniref:Fatty acid hydroxylase domain-containing protein n=1 Tax=Polytolypa hystricis (strain UAMH7299) TaxID=1447883 RepID=A0A2B7YLJ5_POLH7|nr:hypothetical protein AJ80_03155 [Polytolypa hystricis UAMH7299]
MLDAIFFPMLSFLLIPAMSSYSTSLNLLFFYMTWATLVLSHPPLKVEMVGTIAVRALFYLLPSTLFYLFDILVPSGAIVLKAQGHDGLPGGKRGKMGKKQAKIVGWAMLNLASAIALQGLIEFALTRVLGVKSALRVSTRLPMPWAIGKDVALGLLVREILHYTLHRYTLHSTTSFVAKCHESWYHSLPAPYPLTAHYDHPLAYLVSRFVPTFLPAALLRFHLISYIIYLSIISVEETFAYSGYKALPTSFFLGGVARRMDLHVLGKGYGNFGAWGILDWVLGTTIGEDGGEEEEEGLQQGLGEVVANAASGSKKAREVKGRTRRRRDS